MKKKLHEKRRELPAAKPVSNHSDLSGWKPETPEEIAAMREMMKLIDKFNI